MKYASLQFGRHRCEACERIFTDWPCFHLYHGSPRVCSRACLEQWYETDRAYSDTGLAYIRLIERLKQSSICYPEGYLDRSMEAIIHGNS